MVSADGAVSETLEAGSWCEQPAVAIAMTIESGISNRGRHMARERLQLLFRWSFAFAWPPHSRTAATARGGVRKSRECRLANTTNPSRGAPADVGATRGNGVAAGLRRG